MGAEANADYISYTYWLQSNPEGMTYAAVCDPCYYMYEWIYEASRAVNTDLLLKFQDRECAICLEKIAMNCCINGCNGDCCIKACNGDGGKRHLFHAKCLDSWIENGHRNCPSCRGELFFSLFQRGKDIWTWFPCSYRFAEEPAEEAKSEPAEGSGEPAQSEPAEGSGEPADPEEYDELFQERTNSISRRHLEYLDNEAYMNGEYYVTDYETDYSSDSAEEETRSWGDTTNPYEDGVPTQTETLQRCLICLAHKTNDHGFKYLSTTPSTSLIVQAAYEVYLEDKNWEEFTDTCTRILAHFRAEYDDYETDPEEHEEHEETPEGSGEPARVESEARLSFWDDEDNWTDDFVTSTRSIAERYNWDDYETDPEDR
jgi:hypothetical protein